MKEARYFFVPDAGVVNEMPDEEAMHALRVLRLKSGDEMFLMDGAGTFYRAQVTLAATKRCLYEILETIPQQPVWKGHIHLAVAPTKMMERMEWFVEKATEVGIDEFSFEDIVRCGGRPFAAAQRDERDDHDYHRQHGCQKDQK